MILLAALGGLFFAVPQVEAHDRFGVQFGFGNGGFSVRGGVRAYPRRHYAPIVVAPPVHVHTRAPIYREVWVPAQYDTVIAGYDRCGRPVYRTVCVGAGHYESVFVGYRACPCGYHF
jgi:hypothetical protein